MSLVKDGELAPRSTRITPGRNPLFLILPLSASELSRLWPKGLKEWCFVA